MSTPLQKGIGTVRANVTTLMTGRVGPTRKKAIITISRKNNISRGDARFHQAVRIAQSQSRKK